MYKKISILMFFTLQFAFLFAQVSTNFNSKEIITEKGKFLISYKKSVLEIPAPDLKIAYEKEKIELSNGSKMFFFAQPIPVKINILDQINWINDGENSFGRFTLKSIGAKCLSINFKNFFLPKGTEMYIYNDNGEMITGSIGENENNEKKV